MLIRWHCTCLSYGNDCLITLADDKIYVRISFQVLMFVIETFYLVLRCSVSTCAVNDALKPRGIVEGPWDDIGNHELLSRNLYETLF